ncbi:MAG TPA: glycosyltransferase family 2 protein [Bauldia sp.]|nr:glycosyltransferase family 2 protein [Bauldia sp.]
MNVEMRKDAAAESRAGAIELTVVVPTFKEHDNVPLVVERLDKVLRGVHWEVVFVDDDSPDGTSDAVRQIAARDARVRVIQRIGRRGLSTACVEGVLSSSAPYFAVMDGDLQHDDTVLPEMFRRVRAENLDIVVGSRYLGGTRTGGLANPLRVWLSKTGGQVARVILKADLTDPMSGFFVMRRTAFDEAVRGLSQQGFKILLDLFASAQRPLRFAEVECGFNARQHGESKLDTMAAWEFGTLVVDKLVGQVLPLRLVIFALVGGTGIVVHLTVLWLSKLFGADFILSSAIAVVAAMTWNFFFNNMITYRDQRLRGPAFFRGLASFYVIGAIGAFANIGIGQLLFNEARSWWLAGIAGALIGVVWNYTMSRLFTWRIGGR